jgi:hypothetical protein
MATIEIPDDVAKALEAQAKAASRSPQDVLRVMIDWSSHHPAGPMQEKLPSEWVEIQLIPKIRAYRGSDGWELHWCPIGWPSSKKPWAAFSSWAHTPFRDGLGRLATFETAAEAVEALKKPEAFRAPKRGR